MGSVPGFICVLVGFCTCRPRLSSYDNSSVVMWFKLRRLGVYKVKKMGMNLLSQGSGGMPQYSLGSEGDYPDLVFPYYCLLLIT